MQKMKLRQRKPLLNFPGIPSNCNWRIFFLAHARCDDASMQAAYIECYTLQSVASFNAVYVSKWKTQATPIIHFCTELSPSTEITVTMPASCTNRLQKEKTLSRNIIELGISAMALLVIAIYAKHFSDQNEPRVSIRITRIQDNRPIIFLIFLFTFTVISSL